VDIEPQSRYPFRFVQADALEYVREHGHEYDLIAASPPCQAHTSLQGRWGREYPDLIAATRAALIATGKPYVIENVPGAPLLNPITLCGSMFGLKVIRHRIFEANAPIWFPPASCSHPKGAVGRQGHRACGEWMTVTGHFSDVPKAQRAMGIDWMTQAELAQAVPPAYTKWLGERILEGALTA
jgi:DNA (cytosine-5)-methyltransferase 1